MNKFADKRWFVFGASGHGKVVVDAIERCGGVVSFVVDDDPKKNGQSFFGYPVLNREQLLLRRGEIDLGVVAIGDNAVRTQIAAWMSDHLFTFGVVIHPDAVIGRGVTIGEGTVVFAGAVVNSDARIGNHCILNSASSVDHDCLIGDGVHVAPGCVVCGGVSIGSSSFLGAGVNVIPGIRIGHSVVVGAGSTVICDIDDGLCVAGSPARKLRGTGEK